MKLLHKCTSQVLSLSLILVLNAGSLMAQQPTRTGTIRGKVTDELGGILIGSNVTVRNKEGIARTTQTDDDGLFVVTGIIPGQYYVRVEAENFAPYENPALQITAGQVIAVDVKLGVAMERQQVLVNEE